MGAHTIKAFHTVYHTCVCAKLGKKNRPPDISRIVLPASQEGTHAEKREQSGGRSLALGDHVPHKTTYKPTQRTRHTHKRTRYLRGAAKGAAHEPLDENLGASPNGVRIAGHLRLRFGEELDNTVSQLELNYHENKQKKQQGNGRTDGRGVREGKQNAKKV